MESYKKAETKKVKNYLQGLGRTGVSVKHGKGTASGWLYIKVDKFPCDVSGEGFGRDFRGLYQNVGQFTGRSGDYDGRIIIESNKAY